MTDFSKESCYILCKLIITVICFSFTAISDIPRAATRAKQKHRTISTAGSTDNILKFKFLHESGGEERLCQDPSQLGPTWPIIKPTQAASSSALLVHSAAAAAQQRLKPDPGAAGEEHT